jgi:DNA-binding response OmpR family regulator
LIEVEVKEAKPVRIPLFVSGTETVLVAEDDTVVRKFIKYILEEYGYKVIEAADGEDALNKFMENKDNIQLLLLDVIMPKKDGRAVYNEAKKAKRGIKALFISGYAADIIYKKGIMDEGLNFVLKPISSAELLKKIREVLDGSI